MIFSDATNTEVVLKLSLHWDDEAGKYVASLIADGNGETAGATTVASMFDYSKDDNWDTTVEAKETFKFKASDNYTLSAGDLANAMKEATISFTDGETAGISVDDLYDEGVHQYTDLTATIAVDWTEPV